FKPEVRVNGEPDALKGARPVREGADENVPQGNASAAYFTIFCAMAMNNFLDGTRPTPGA
ncbi:MAG: hypothetical protein M3Y81_18665, partial [Chloroflexota bacterium]|nr:hypothetical protein [Chloroflexota bacterium]